MTIVPVSSHFEETYFIINNGLFTSASEIADVHKPYQLLTAEEDLVKRKLIPGNNWSSAVHSKLKVYNRGGDKSIDAYKEAVVLCSTRGEVFLMIKGINKLIQVYAFDAFAQRVESEEKSVRIINTTGKVYDISLLVGRDSKIHPYVRELAKTNRRERNRLDGNEFKKDESQSTDNKWKNTGVDSPVRMSGERLIVDESNENISSLVTLEKGEVKYLHKCLTKDLMDTLNKFRKSVRSGWIMDKKVNFLHGGYIRFIYDGVDRAQILQRAETRTCEDEFTASGTRGIIKLVNRLSDSMPLEV